MARHVIGHPPDDSRTDEPLTPDRGSTPRSGVTLIEDDLPTGPLVRVRVAAWTQINHGGRVYPGGDVFRAPRVLADRWIAAGWADEAGH